MAVRWYIHSFTGGPALTNTVLHCRWVYSRELLIQTTRSSSLRRTTQDVAFLYIYKSFKNTRSYFRGESIISVNTKSSNGDSDLLSRDNL